MEHGALLDILRCPACAGGKGADPGQLDLIGEQWLVCRDCDRKYPIRDRIPVMLISEGDKHQDTPIAELARECINRNGRRSPRESGCSRSSSSK